MFGTLFLSRGAGGKPDQRRMARPRGVDGGAIVAIAEVWKPHPLDACAQNRRFVVTFLTVKDGPEPMGMGSPAASASYQE